MSRPPSIRPSIVPRVSVWLICGLSLMPAYIVKADSPPGDSDLMKRFFDEYPRAVEKLRGAVENVHGNAKFRHRNAGTRKDPWTAIEFYKSGSMFRLHERSPEEMEISSKGKIVSEEAVLISSDVSAVVRSPKTEFAWTQRLEKSPSKVLNLRVQNTLQRFLESLYSTDGTAILDSLRSGQMTAKSVTPSQLHPGWVTLTYTNLIKGEGTDPDAHVDGEITFSPDEDWAVREHHYRSAAPFNYTCHFYIDDLLPIPGKGYLPKTLTMLGFDGVEAPAAPRTATNWMECSEYELVDVESKPLPASEFTLAALGIRASTWDRPIGIALVSLAIAIVLVLLTRRVLPSGHGRDMKPLGSST